MPPPISQPAIRKLRLAAGELPGKFPRDAMLAREDFRPAIDALAAALDKLATELGLFAQRTEEIGNLAARADDLSRRLARWRDTNDTAAGSETPLADDESAGASASPVDRDQRRGTMPSLTPAEEWIRWVDVTAYGWQLQASPLSVAPLFRRQLDASARAWIFTSATLAVGRDFSHYTSSMGLDGAQTGCWDSPFDYPSQALLCVPRGLPEPNQPAHTDAVVDAALPVIEAAGGRAFLLFTTLRALSRARERLQEAFARAGHDFPLLVQGEALEDRAARPLPRAGQRRAAGQRELLGRRRRSRRCALAGGDRQAAVRAAGRSAAGGAPRAPARPMVATRSATTSCRRRRSRSSRARGG